MYIHDNLSYTYTILFYSCGSNTLPYLYTKTYTDHYKKVNCYTICYNGGMLDLILNRKENNIHLKPSSLGHFWLQRPVRCYYMLQNFFNKCKIVLFFFLTNCFECKCVVNNIFGDGMGVSSIWFHLALPILTYRVHRVYWPSFVPSPSSQHWPPCWLATPLEH